MNIWFSQDYYRWVLQWVPGRLGSGVQGGATSGTCFSSPGHGYHFLEYLEYVHRVARHKVRSSQKVAWSFSKPSGSYGLSYFSVSVMGPLMILHEEKIFSIGQTLKKWQNFWVVMCDGINRNYVSFWRTHNCRAGTPLACWATPWVLVLPAFMPPPSPSTSRLSSCWTWSNRSVGGWTSWWKEPGTQWRWDSTWRRRPALSLRRFIRPMRRPWRGC